MEYSAALINGLTLLSDALDDPISDLQAILSVLTDDLTAAVPDYLGLTVTLHVDDNPVVITTLDAGNTVEIRASLLLPLLAPQETVSTGCVSFYSGTAGMFIDVADDARWIFDLAGPPVLDAHLAPPGGDPPAFEGSPRSATSTRPSAYSSQMDTPRPTRTPNSGTAPTGTAKPCPTQPADYWTPSPTGDRDQADQIAPTVGTVSIERASESGQGVDVRSWSKTRVAI